jgi:hypothetical protein
MKTPSKELQALFIELLTAELSSFKRVSLNMLNNTILFITDKAGFNQYPIEYWYTLASANGFKYNI